MRIGSKMIAAEEVEAVESQSGLIANTSLEDNFVKSKLKKTIFKIIRNNLDIFLCLFKLVKLKE